MADIDDELLALAGGDSEDEGSVRSSREPSASPPARDSGKSRKPKRAPRGDESEEEGEALSGASTPNSLESAPMDESDSDDEQPSRARASAPRGGDDDDKYPVDGMFMSQTEKAEIMALREVEREQIIADRISEIERQRQNRLLRQMVTTVENEERKTVKKKRSADTAELEDDDRRSSRQRTGKVAETAMDSLRRARAEKQRRKEDHERRKDYSPRRDSREPESDDDFGRARSLTPEKDLSKELPPPELKDYEHVRVGRDQFAQVCSTPGFDAAITGCYVRLAVGPHPETGIEQYRMALIKGFTTGRPYAMTGPNGPFVTDQYMKAAHGKAIKEFPFIAASNGKFASNELGRYQITCNNEGITLPTLQPLLDKVDAINVLLKHDWTSEQIKARVAKRNELKRRFDPAERERVARMLDEAVSRGDEGEAERLQNELDQLSKQRLAFKTSLGPSKLTDTSAVSSEQDWLAERNRENRRMNAELVRKAQLKEKAKTREVQRALSRGEAVIDDPSRRLRTKAKFVHDVNETPQKPSQNGSAASTPANGTTPKVSATMPQMATHMAKLQEKKYEENKGLPTIHKPLVDDDIIGALDLDIDVEI
ncbi:RNA polymerase II transcription elongation factor Rtf1p [Purpureocillium lavendulum]|uniref:RNA polymerase II transcription elongation factor Rtf1p n=1 Tax=Purpureocillium lavendulum TaxID=1247861 RepID=A0AB34FNP0_9HYPO|nr:RNA polymerase II transcription elongation factor Rtf1p [Purpureocillium lavendulum]